MGKERTSVVSTPSLAELYRFVHEEEEKGRGTGTAGREGSRERGGQGEETAHMDDMWMDVKVQDSNLSQCEYG